MRAPVPKAGSCLLTAALVLAAGLGACTFESRNRISRSLQNWTGTNGVVDIFSDGKVMMRFINVEKLTTGEATGGEAARPYRFGYGVLDVNQNYRADPDEKKLYFEVGEHATFYVFYENPLS